MTTLDIPLTHPLWPSTVLRGPADADHYRIKVGRYGDRWYQDGDNGPYPSISTVKKAAGKDWSFVSLKRVAHADPDELAQLPQLDPAVRYDRVKSIDRHGLNVAAGRGTIIHWWFEDMLTTGRMRDVSPQQLQAAKIPAAALEEAEHYRAAIAQFFDTYQPEVIAAEMVVIHTSLNDVGYGGTGDALLRIEGENRYGDWKSRGIDSDHGAYPEEGAQIAAAAKAEYMIVGDGDGITRIPPPPAVGGLVVSIKHDGCRLYPVDLDQGFAHFTALHAWWVARRDERAAIGKPWAPRQGGSPCPDSTPSTNAPDGMTQSGRTTSISKTPATSPTRSAKHSTTPTGTTSIAGSNTSKSSALVTDPDLTGSDRRTRLLERYQSLTEQQQLAFTALGIPRDDLDSIEKALDELDPFQHVAEPPERSTPQPAPPVEQDEWVDANTLAALVDTISASPHRNQLNALIREANAGGQPWNPRPKPTVANYERCRAAFALVAIDPEAWPVMLDNIAESDAPVGVRIGTLTVDQCGALIDMCERY